MPKKVFPGTSALLSANTCPFLSPFPAEPTEGSCRTTSLQTTSRMGKPPTSLPCLPSAWSAPSRAPSPRKLETRRSCWQSARDRSTHHCNSNTVLRERAPVHQCFSGSASLHKEKVELLPRDLPRDRQRAESSTAWSASSAGNPVLLSARASCPPARGPSLTFPQGIRTPVLPSPHTLILNITI